MSGMYDMKPVRLSKRSSLASNSPTKCEHAMSSQRHLNLLRAPVIASYGTNETPEFKRQNRDFAAAVKAAGNRSNWLWARATTISRRESRWAILTGRTDGRRWRR